MTHRVSAVSSGPRSGSRVPANLELGPTGAVLSPAEDGFVGTAVALERLGCSTIWLTGGAMSSRQETGLPLATAVG